MSNALQHEKHILRFVGPHFDPAADYTHNTKLLINDLLLSRGQKQAVIAVNETIKLVRNRLGNPKLRPADCDLKQQHAFLVWLESLRQQLGPDVKKPKPKPIGKGLREEFRKRKAERKAEIRARTNPGYLSRECQAQKPGPGASI